MFNRILTLASMLVLGVLSSSPVYAALLEVQGSYELDATLVSVPTNTSGYLLFRSCSQCTVKSLRVSNETQYILGNDSVTLAEFHEHSVMQGLIYVFYDKQSQLVTRVRLRAGGLNQQ